MRVESVEIYSDATNAAVMRHPGRRFPGVLLQGDTLHSMCRRLDIVCEAARRPYRMEEYQELNNIRNGMWDLLLHYKRVLQAHGMPLPFSED